MSFATFKAHADALAAREGWSVKYRRYDDGRFAARFSGGMEIVGNHTTIAVGVYFRGRNHYAITRLGEGF